MAGIRSFVAIELPDEVRTALADLQAKLKAQTPPNVVRWARPESIHLTLQFLGDVAPGQVESIGHALQEIGAGQAPFTFQLRDLGVFPNPRRVRVVWVGVEESSGELTSLQKQINQALSPLGFEPEKRPFSPHITLGRADRRAGQRDLAQVGEQIVSSQVGTVGQVRVDHITLMKSDLKPGGAVYTPLAIAAFGK
jgi:2'-5' RNA ligase